MISRFRYYSAVASLLGFVLQLTVGLHAVSAQSVVRVERNGDQFSLLCNGRPYRIKGVGGTAFLKELTDAGGNTIRTWDCKNLGEVLDEAAENNLMVCAGIWMGHPRHGFNYQSDEAVLAQFREKLKYVHQYKDHPALLMWAVGNEAEGEGKDPGVWYAINHLAREIRAIDPHHPTMTVIAELGANEVKLHNIAAFCPDVQVIGINSYGGIESVGERFRNAGIDRPYVITEHGPIGPWEIGKTSWGSPVEWTSTEKAAFYSRGYVANVRQHSDVCLGAFSFLWGHKQETTATWFGMLLPDGTRLGAADAMSALWTGRKAANACPEILTAKLSRTDGLKPGETLTASVVASDPENDALNCEWVVRADGGTIGEGGDPQEAEAALDGLVRSKGAHAIVTVPEEPGAYRLFIYIRDHQGGAAVANIPFRVAGLKTLKNEMKTARLPYIVYGDDSAANNVFIPSGYMGKADAVTMTADCTDNPFKGRSCLQVNYNSAADWGGVLWQSPAGDWDGKQPGGANLTGADRLEFYARGEKGGEVVNFVFGVLNGSQPYPDTATGELENVELTTEWKRYSIDLKDMDLRQIKTGFGWSLSADGAPVTFYLDEIRYVAQ